MESEVVLNTCDGSEETVEKVSKARDGQSESCEPEEYLETAMYVKEEVLNDDAIQGNATNNTDVNVTQGNVHRNDDIQEENTDSDKSEKEKSSNNDDCKDEDDTNVSMKEGVENNNTNSQEWNEEEILFSQNGSVTEQIVVPCMTWPMLPPHMLLPLSSSNKRVRKRGRGRRKRLTKPTTTMKLRQIVPRVVMSDDIATDKSSDQNEENNLDEYPQLVNSLPEYLVPWYQQMGDGFQDEVRVALKDEAAAKKWLADCKKARKGRTLRVRKPRPVRNVTIDCACTHLKLDEIPQLKGILPPSYTYKICKYEPKEDDTTQFETEIRMATTTKEELLKWMEQFQDTSKTTLRVDSTFHENTQRNVYKRTYRCQHKTDQRSRKQETVPSPNPKKQQPTKNTHCQAKLIATVKRIYNHSRSKNEHLPDWPTVITIRFTHNHPLNTADTLRYRDVSKETVDKLTKLFENGYGPTQALEQLKYDYQVEGGQNFEYVTADRATCPNIGFCHRLYKNLFKKEFKQEEGEAKHNSLLATVEKRIEEYNESIGRRGMAVEVVNESDVVVAILTPLMMRVHQLIKHTGELCFMDASGNMDRKGCRVFSILTHSYAGGLPLGVLITTSENTETITRGLVVFNSLLNHSCFYGRGIKGPMMFMTDDNASEMLALHSVYPESRLFLCIFHILQAFWIYLGQAKNAIKKDDRPMLFSLMKRMVYCETYEELNYYYQQILGHPVIAKYSHVRVHLEGIFSRRQEWALCYKNGYMVRSNNTHCYVEPAMRVVKDLIPERKKSYSVLQLIHFVTTKLDEYYERRLTDLNNHRLDKVIQARFLMNSSTDANINWTGITNVGDSLYKVPSDSKPDISYLVDAAVGLCTCFAGKNGGPCKHQYIVMKTFNITPWNFFPVNDVIMRQEIHQVATGKTNFPEAWSQNMHGEGTSTAHLQHHHQQQPTTSYYNL